MPSKILTDYMKIFILNHRNIMTCRQIADYLDLTPATVRSFLNRRKLKYKLQRMSHGSNPDLTKREREIMALVAGGYSNKRLTKELHLSITTIRTHITSIYQKLQVVAEYHGDMSVRVRAVNEFRKRYCSETEADNAK